MQSIGIKFPFTETNEGGVIGQTKIDSEAIRSNLVAFLTLKKRQRVMNSGLYSPLYDYIMEPWDEISESSLTGELNEKLSTYFPEIKVEDYVFEFIEEENLLNFTLYYFIDSLKIRDSISINLVIEN